MNIPQIIEKVGVVAPNERSAEISKARNIDPDSAELLNSQDILSLIDYIISVHHKYAKENAVAIHKLLQDLMYTSKYPELKEVAPAFSLFMHDVLNNIMKEEKILFPNIIMLVERNRKNNETRYTTFGLIRNIIAGMLHTQHCAYKEMMHLRALTDGYDIPAGACGDYAILYGKMKEFEQHYLLQVELENEMLFPSAMAEDGGGSEADILKIKTERRNHVQKDLQTK